MSANTPSRQAEGHTDTPFLPGLPYRVHDANRPQPRIVTPGELPSDATILFGGFNLAGWVSSKTGQQAEWQVRDGYMEVTPGSGDIQTTLQHGDIQLHLEWATQEVPEGDGQGRGNSGVFLQSLYEVQVLDCYQNPTYADGTTGALYGQTPPLVNACLPPGSWQTYDIVFIAARWSEGRLLAPAYLTLIHNGILIHHHRPLLGPTRWKSVPSYYNPPALGPLKLQDHRNLVRFRNIWWREIGNYDA